MKQLLVALTALTLFAVSLATVAAPRAAEAVNVTYTSPTAGVSGGGTGDRIGDPQSGGEYAGTYASNDQIGNGHYSFRLSYDAPPGPIGVVTFTRSDGMTLSGTLDIIVPQPRFNQCDDEFDVAHGTCLSADLTGTADIASASILISLLEPPGTNQTALFFAGELNLRRRIGYTMLDANGTTYTFGGIDHSGNAFTPDAVDIERMPGINSYWILTRTGRVITFANLPSYGSANLTGDRAIGMAATPASKGYWIFTAKGRAIPFGDARSFGDLSATRLNGTIIDAVATPTGRGYYMVGTDGGVFSFGDAKFHGSTGNLRLNQPVVGLVPTRDSAGYWLVASDGGVFSFAAPFRGSMGAHRLNQPIVSMVGYGDGYLMIARDGGVFNFSKELFFGSAADAPRSGPVVAGIAAS